MTTDIDPQADSPADPDNDRTRPITLPFTWAPGPGPAEPDDQDVWFRFPTADDPRPGTRRLLGMALYASMLGMLGLAVAVRGVFLVADGLAPGWYELLFPFAGLLGVAMVVGAFMSMHRHRLPWALLLGAAVPLAANIALTLAVG